MTHHLPEGGAGYGTASNADASQALRDASNISPEGGVLKTGDRVFVEAVVTHIDPDGVHMPVRIEYALGGTAWVDYTALSAAPPISPRGVSDGPWRCFHCEEVCETVEEAEHHFGKFQDCTPACRIGAELFRKMEDELSSWRTGSDTATKEFYGLGAAHAVALRRTEEQGYERGLADGRALSLPTGSGAWTLADVGITPHISTDPAEVAAIEEALAALSPTPGLGNGKGKQEVDGLPGSSSTADAACVAEATTLVPGEREPTRTYRMGDRVKIVAGRYAGVEGRFWQQQSRSTELLAVVDGDDGYSYGVLLAEIEPTPLNPLVPGEVKP